MTLPGKILVAGPPASAPALVLTAPISFWGGVSPRTGTIADPRHPQHGESLVGRVVFIPATIGSVSASAILLELVHAGLAPAALVLHEPDAILLLGLIVAREMGWPAPVAAQLDVRHHAQFDGASVSVDREGNVSSQ